MNYAVMTTGIAIGMKSYTVRVLAVIAAVSVIVNVLLFFRYSSSRPIVTVGGTTVTRKQFQDQLEHDDGQAVLTKLVFTALVTQAAARAGVLPTGGDVEDRMQALARQAPQVLAPYSGDPVKLAQFKQDLTTDMALENLRIQDVALSPAQIAGYYAQHQADFALPPQATTTVVVTQNEVNSATAADLLRQNDPPDVISRQPGLRVVGISGYNPDLGTLPVSLKKETTDWATHAKIGSVKTFEAGAFYLTFRVTGRQPAVVPPLSQVRGKVERAARLQLAPSQPEELARLYQKAKPEFNSDKYASYFTAVQQYPLNADGTKKTANAP